MGSSTRTTSASGSMRLQPAGADGGRHALGDDRVPGRDRPGQPELVLQPQPARGLGQQVADPRRAAATHGRLGVALGHASRPRRDDAVGRHVDRPRRAHRAQAPGPGRRASWWSRTPAAAPAIRRTRWARRSGSSSENTSSRSSSGGRPSSAVRRSSSASLKARIAVRCWPRDANDASGRPPISNTRSSRCGPDQRRPVPDLLLGRLGEPARQRVPDRLAGLLRGVGGVGQAEAPGRRLVGRDLGVGGRERPGQGLEEPLPLRRAPRCRPRAASRPRTASSAARRLLLADEPQQPVALLERAAVGRQVPEVRRGPLARQAVEGLAAERRRSGDEQHLLGGEHHRPQHADQRRGAPAPRRSPGSACGRRRSRCGRARPRRCPAPRGPCPAPRSVPPRARAPGPSGRARRRPPCDATGPRRPARSPRGGSSCRRRSVPRRAAGRAGRPRRASAYPRRSRTDKPEQDRGVAAASRVGREQAGRRVRRSGPQGVRQEVVRTGITTCT